MNLIFLCVFEHFTTESDPDNPLHCFVTSSNKHVLDMMTYQGILDTSKFVARFSQSLETLFTQNEAIDKNFKINHAKSDQK